MNRTLRYREYQFSARSAVCMLVSGILVLCANRVAQAQCPAVDFDDLPIDTEVTNQYAGVTFALEDTDFPGQCDAGSCCSCDEAFFPTIRAFGSTCSGGKALWLEYDNDGCEFCPLFLTMIFDAPASNVEFCIGETSTFGCSFGDFNVRAYDSPTTGAGTLLQDLTFDCNPGDAGSVAGPPVSVSTPGFSIRRIELQHTERLDFLWGAIDSLTFDVPVTITDQPDDRTICAGNATSFSVAANSNLSIQYQWQKNGINLSNGGHYSGVTAPTLSVSNIDASDAANYRCVVSNGCTAVNSSSASLTVNQAPQFTDEPDNQTVCVGDSVMFSVTASGTPSVSYQWQKDGANLSNGGHYSGVTTATLTVSSAGSADAANYRCVISNTCGMVTSMVASLNVTAPPQILDHPDDQVVCVGDPTNLSVIATGTAPLQYQWKKNGANLTNGGHYSGVTTPALSISNATGTDAGFYQCDVSNTCGLITSLGATVSVLPGPQITDQPDSLMVATGGTAMFSVVVDGAGAVSYQWRRDAVPISDGPAPGGGVISGATSAALMVTQVGCDDVGLYDVVVTDSCGATTSAIAALDLLASSCPPGGSPKAVDTYQIAGAGTGTPWSWRIESDDGAFLGSVVVSVTGVAGTELDVALAFADSIDNYFGMVLGCSSNSLSAQARAVFGTVILSIETGCDSPFTLYVGPSGGPASCEVTTTLPACSFNPTIELLPLPGADCNDNGFDDFIDILAGDSLDENENGVPDECEGVPCADNGDCVLADDAANAVCTFDRCVANICTQEAAEYGDVNGAGPSNPNLDDILCCLGGFGNFDACPNADIRPVCMGNDIINLDDILGVLAAFGGDDPCGCTP